MGLLQRAELARSLQLYFQSKGGSAPGVSNEVLPVVIVDHDGPYPPYRSWQCSAALGAVVGNYGYVGVVNVDAPGKGSVLAVDSVVVRTAPTDDVRLIVTVPGVIPLASLFDVEDVAEEKENAPSAGPLLGNVRCGSLSSVTATGSTFFPMGDALIHQINGPWLVGPGGEFLVRTNSVNVALTVHLRGRYYSQL